MLPACISALGIRSRRRGHRRARGGRCAADARRGGDGLRDGAQRHGVVRLFAARTRRCAASWGDAARAQLRRAVAAGARWIRFAEVPDARRRARPPAEGLRRALRLAAHQQRRVEPAAAAAATRSDMAGADLPRRRRRHRRGRQLGRAHQAARQAHDAPRGDDRPGRLRRPVRAARRLPRAAAGLVHRRRRHQAQARLPDRPARHRRASTWSR